MQEPPLLPSQPSTRISPPPSGTEEDVESRRPNNVVYMINQCQMVSTHRVPSLIFSFLEIFEILRLKRTNKQLCHWAEAYFQQLHYLDLSPYFGYTTTEEQISKPTFCDGKSFITVFKQLCPRRTNLSLAYSTQLTCSALKHFLLPDNWSEKLVRLNLYFCTKLKRAEVCDILCECSPDLQYLNLSMIHKLSLIGLQKLLLGLRELRQISFVGSFKVGFYAEEEMEIWEDIETNLRKKFYENLFFIDCRRCTLLNDRVFWQPANDQEAKQRASTGVYQRGRTWILGPEEIQIKQIKEIPCLYPDCGFINSKSAIRCKSCQRSLLLVDFISKNSSFIPFDEIS